MEKYGGPLLATWLDRPLSVAGRLLARTENGFREYLVDMEEPVAVIPSVAIHMNREANDKASYNMAVDMLPLIGERGDGVPDLRTRMAEKLGIREVYGVCLCDNLGSRRVLEKCGFEPVFEGVGDYQGRKREIFVSVRRL